MFRRLSAATIAFQKNIIKILKNYSVIRVRRKEATKYGVKLFKSNLNLAMHFASVYIHIYFYHDARPW